MSEKLNEKDPELAALEAELAAAQAEERAVQEKIARDKRKRELSAEVERTKRAAVEAQALEEAEQKYGPLGTHIRRVDTLDGMVIVKRPERLLFKRFQELDPKQINAAETRKLVRPSVVYPTLECFDVMIEERPGILGECAIAVCELGGMKVREFSGK